MGQIINMRRQMCKKGTTKPYDAEIEYLQNTDKQYIDTQFIPKDTPRIILEVLFDDTKGSDLFGFEKDAVPSFIGNINRVGNGIKYDYYRYYYNQYYTNKETYLCDVNVFHTLDFGHQIKIDDTMLFEGTGKKSFADNNQSVMLFHGRTNLFKRCKIKWCKLYDGDVLMRDMIAVRKGGIGYMYDRVSGELFGNAGTGEFTLGKDKV